MNFYKIYNDGDNQYLVPLADWDTIMNLSKIVGDDPMEDVLSAYDRLEGQDIVVVLESEVVA